MNKIGEYDFQAGAVLLFNKPESWTSFDVVKKIRNVVRVKKVGHAGTLDPLATGLLILCTGRATKQIQSIQDTEKEYVVEFRLGAVTASYDSEFPPEEQKDCSHLSRADIEAAIPTFTGEIKQYPPVFSAVKIKGKRAYESARKGKTVELNPRFVTVREFELLDFQAPDLASARVVCSKGTYIRSLVHDLGQHLQVGAYITALCRTRIGDHLLENAWEIDDFAREVREFRRASSESSL